MKDKIIIHNYTNLEDWDVLFKIIDVICQGKISETKAQGRQYCFLTRFKNNIVVECIKRNDTYTFKIYEE